MIAKLPVAWREALEELSRRKLRTLLTLLGLIFGIGAIVAMQAVGEGSRREALRLVQGLGLNNLIVEAKSRDEDSLREERARTLGLTLADAAAALSVVPGAEQYAGSKAIRTYSVGSDAGQSDAQASGVELGVGASLVPARHRALKDVRRIPLSKGAGKIHLKADKGTGRVHETHDADVACRRVGRATRI